MTLAEQIAAMNAAKNGGAAPAATATAPVGSPLGASVSPGGNRLAEIRAALQQASIGGGRNKMPCGTAWMLLKNGAYRVADLSKTPMSSFSFLCIHAIADGDNAAPSSPTYNGPRVGDEYDVTLFQSGKYLKSMVNQNMQALSACMGWHPDYVKQLQATQDGLMLIEELLKGLLGVSLDGVPTNQPCAFSNQVVIEMHTKATVKEEKGSDGQPSYDAQGNKKMKTYVNTYWNKRIALQEVLATLGDEAVIKAFGSAEAFQAAYQAEIEMANLATGG